jgi:hypothetical protein
VTLSKDKFNSSVPAPKLPKLNYPSSFKVSFDFFAGGSNFKWPLNPGDSFLLAAWLYELSTKQNLNSLLSLIPENFEGNPHHEIGRNEFTHAANKILDKLQQNDLFNELIDYRIISLRYCLTKDSTERLLGVVRDNVLYVLWWDINHESYSKPLATQSRGECLREDCGHPAGYKFSQSAYNRTIQD